MKQYKLLKELPGCKVGDVEFLNNENCVFGGGCYYDTFNFNWGEYNILDLETGKWIEGGEKDEH